MSQQIMRFNHIRSRKGSLSEFGPALFVFLFFTLFPAIDLLAVAAGATTIALAARQAASAAASSSTYGAALAATRLESREIINSGLGRFVNLTPVAGCGADLWLIRTNFRTNAIEYCGPNRPCQAPIDQSNYVYEYAVVCKYQVGPLCNLGSIPFIGSIPGLGRPATIKYVGTMASEFPNGQTDDGQSGNGPPISVIGGHGSIDQPPLPWVATADF